MKFLRPTMSAMLLLGSVAMARDLPLEPVQMTGILLPNGDTVRVLAKSEVHVNPERDFHGPALVRAANGDILLFHQNSQQHEGGEAIVDQLRSTDNGRTWKQEAPAADWRGRHKDAMFGEAGLISDGRLVMVVQLREKTLRGDQDISAAWLQVSKDHGKIWTDAGPADPTQPERVMNSRSFFSHQGQMYFTAWSSKLGGTLYASASGDGLRWHRVSDVFPRSETQPFPYQGTRPFSPFYPNVVFCPDGSVLAVTYNPPPDNVTWVRRSQDGGSTWGQPEVAKALANLWAPRLKRVSQDVLMLTARDIEQRATVAIFSTDSGRTWSPPLVLDRPKFYGSYAYTDSIDVGEGKFLIVTSSPQQGTPVTPDERGMGIARGKGDIISVLIELRTK